MKNQNSSSEYQKLHSKSKSPAQVYSKMNTLLSYFEEWEQDLVARESSLRASSLPKSENLDDSDHSDCELRTNEQLLNNFKRILEEKEAEIRALQANITEKERIITLKSKEMTEIQGRAPLVERVSNSLRNKEEQLRELNQNVENKRHEVMSMWDEVVLKAEILEKKEKENEMRRAKLEEKHREYEDLVSRINEEKANFFQTQAIKIDNERERKLTEREGDLIEKARAFEEKQRDFMIKCRRVYELIKNINKSLKSTNLANLLKDELFADMGEGEDLSSLTERLSSFENSLNKSNAEWSVGKDGSGIEEAKEEAILGEKEENGVNNVPFFNKNESSSMEAELGDMNSLSFSRKEGKKENIGKTKKEAKLYLPFQGRTNL